MIKIDGLEDLEKFGLQAEFASKKIDNDLNDVKKTAADFIFLKVMKITRVDTSKAISNWTIRTPDDEKVEREAYFPGERGSTKAQSFQQNLMTERPNLKEAKPGKPIYVSNNLDYVEDYLNEVDNILIKAEKTGDYRIKESWDKRMKTRGGYFK